MKPKKTPQKSSEKAKRLLEDVTKNELLSIEKEELVDKYLKLNNELKKCYKEYLLMFDKAANLEKKLQELENKNIPLNKYEGYYKLESWVEKICFIISRNPPTMDFKGITQAILLLEKNISYKWVNVDNYVSQVLNTAYKRKLISRTGTRGHYFYSLSENTQNQALNC